MSRTLHLVVVIALVMWAVGGVISALVALGLMMDSGGTPDCITRPCPQVTPYPTR